MEIKRLRLDQISETKVQNSTDFKKNQPNLPLLVKNNDKSGKNQDESGFQASQEKLNSSLKKPEKVISALKDVFTQQQLDPIQGKDPDVTVTSDIVNDFDYTESIRNFF